MSAKRLDLPVEGGSLAAFELGVAAADAQPALAVHGITANSHGWLAVQRALPPGASLVAVDLRGRGASNSLPPPYGIDAHVRDLVAALDRLAIERAVVVGHSLGAYVVARLAVEHPQRVRAAVLVDGGLRLPGSAGAEPQAFLDAFLGPALARLRMRFATREAYRDWWLRHPAIASSDIADQDLAAYADHDLVGEEPELRSSVLEEAVRADAADLLAADAAAARLSVPAKLLCAPRGLLDDPAPMQPLGLVREWAAASPALREAIAVPDVNHYSIVMGASGARAVAEAVAATSAIA